MFQLSKDECLRCQIVTLNEGRGQHLKYMPYAFTENGIAMLDDENGRDVHPVDFGEDLGMAVF